MFARKLIIERIDATGEAHLCPVKWIDSFSMRNFTNDAIFDDTLPVADGLLEAGYRVPLDRLQSQHGRLVPPQELSRARATTSALRKQSHSRREPYANSSAVSPYR